MAVEPTLEADNQLQAAEVSRSKARIIHTGVPQGSKLSPTLFSFYIADMPKPREPVNADMLRG